MSDTEQEKADLLYGAKAIAQHLGLEEKPTRHRIYRKIIPTFKIGDTICARRSTIAEWLAELEAKAGADD